MTRQEATSGWVTRATLAAVIGGVAALSACGASRPAATPAPTTARTTASTTSGGATNSPSSTTAAVAPAATGSTTTPLASAPATIPDGTYRLAANPNCGEFQVDGAALVVRGDIATITQVANGEQVPGSIARQGSSFHLHAANGTVVVIDLTGSANAAGTLTGSGHSGGVNLNGQTGWVCSFAFTASPQTATSPAGPVQTAGVEEFRSPSRNVGCEIDYHRGGVPDAVHCQTFSPPQSVTMSTSGAFTTCTGQDCLGNPGEGTPTLAYGDTTAIGPFKCASAVSGITCTAAGTGFEISSSGITKVP